MNTIPLNLILSSQIPNSGSAKIIPSAAEFFSNIQSHFSGKTEVIAGFLHALRIFPKSEVSKLIPKFLKHPNLYMQTAGTYLIGEMQLHKFSGCVSDKLLEIGPPHRRKAPWDSDPLKPLLANLLKSIGQLNTNNSSVIAEINLLLENGECRDNAAETLGKLGLFPKEKAELLLAKLHQGDLIYRHIKNPEIKKRLKERFSSVLSDIFTDYEQNIAEDKIEWNASSTIPILSSGDQITNKEDQELILRILSYANHGSLCIACAEALTKINLDQELIGSAVSILLARLFTSDPTVHEDAARALGRIGAACDDQKTKIKIIKKLYERYSMKGKIVKWENGARKDSYCIYPVIAIELLRLGEFKPEILRFLTSEINPEFGYPFIPETLRELDNLPIQTRNSILAACLRVTEIYDDKFERFRYAAAKTAAKLIEPILKKSLPQPKMEK